MFHAIVAVFAVSGILWALGIWVAGGITATVLGMTIRSHDPLRPLAVGCAAAALYVATRGPVNGRRLVVPLAIVMALATAGAGIGRNSWTAGGADSYAYVSQADLWLAGDLSVEIPLAASAPWPDATSTFAPHGFRPAVSPGSIVPVTAPGLPLMMAAAKRAGGHCAMFLVTPLFGAWLVLVTFAIGRRAGDDRLGLAAAWLVATSPAVLAMLVSPMSDVPAAALWATAIYGAIGTSGRSAWLSGAWASAAILVRPNLAPLAAVLVLWKWWSPRKTDALRIAAGAVPGCLAIAAVNHRLYGSPLESGYGSLASLFSLSNVATNAWRYGGWLAESQTPLALAAIAALILPARRLWPAVVPQQTVRLLGATLAVVWALYLIYFPYEAWWFLRFLLPSWPALCLGMAAIVLSLAGSGSRPRTVVAYSMLIAIGVYGVRYAVRNGAFPTGEGDRRYASMARLVETGTDGSAVVFAGQHAGPTRYYAGRTIVRFDLLDPAWLDRSLEWLRARGRRPYFLLDEWEVPLFRARFEGARTGALALAPVVEYRAPGVPDSVYLFDPARPDGGALVTAPPDAGATCVLPSPLLHLP